MGYKPSPIKIYRNKKAESYRIVLGDGSSPYGPETRCHGADGLAVHLGFWMQDVDRYKWIIKEFLEKLPDSQGEARMLLLGLIASTQPEWEVIKIDNEIPGQQEESDGS